MVKFFNGLEGCGGGGEWLGQLGDRWWSSWVETMVVLWCSGEGGMMEGKRGYGVVLFVGLTEG